MLLRNGIYSPNNQWFGIKKMKDKLFSMMQLAFAAILLSIFAAFPAWSQDDPDPNSPPPVLVRGSDPTRALVSRVRKFGGSISAIDQSRSAFPLNSKVNIYISNIELMDGEDARAFRVYAEDSDKQRYRFPVLDIQPVKAAVPTYAITVELRDEVGYYTTPAKGDVLIRVTWRGMTSDRLRLGIGKTGGKIKDDVRPFSTLVTDKTSSNNAVASPGYVGYRWSGDRMRFLEQTTFGPNAELDARIRRIGLSTWLAEQFEEPYPSSANPYPDMPLRPTMPLPDCDGSTKAPGFPESCYRDTYTMYLVQAWFFREAYYGDAQLRHKIAWILSQMWVTSGLSLQQSRWMTEYHKVLARNAFGNYRELIKQMTLNPGMGLYLDMARSTKNNPNENYAREVLQLFTIGLFMLNQDGTLQRDAQNNPIPTYDQDTVNNFTKVFTGWNFCNVTCSNAVPGLLNFIDPLIPQQPNHDISAKTLLSYPGAINQNIPAGMETSAELELAIDNIFYHPNVGPFVSKFFIQHLVTSDPTAAYVGRVTSVFNNNGFGVRGDMKAVIKAVLLDPEARGDVKTDPNFGKLREPVQLWTNVARTIGVRSSSGATQSDGVFYSPTNNLFTAMGQTVFYSPSVFNYYPPDYVIPGTTLLGPEFSLMTTGTAVSRANFANTMVYSHVLGGQQNVPDGTALQFGELQAISAQDASANRLLDVLDYRMMHGTMSAAMRDIIRDAVTAIPAENSLARARQAVYLLMTSSQYQIQR